jgi:hypothetical protein
MRDAAGGMVLARQKTRQTMEGPQQPKPLRRHAPASREANEMGAGNQPPPPGPGRPQPCVR